MSSTFIPPLPEYLDRRMASSPALSTRSVNDVRNDGVRPMKLKVHYTFDNENKTNHLVRWRDEVRVRTAYLDEKTQVGVIELKTCINAICNASPELVARLGQDYTIYAYDYSEYETPLVGQGMLSWILASSKPAAPADQSSTMVTGRVSKRLGLFSGGAPETLEVKLRLVPVPTSLQSEYVESMNKYRELSMVMPEGFDHQGWSSFLKANPDILSMLQCGNRTPTTEAPLGNMGIEHVQRLMNHGYIPPSVPNQANLQHSSNFSGFANGSEVGRGSSPAPSVHSMQTSRAPPSRSGSRPSSRQTSISVPPDSGYLSNDERVEEGRPKKRAKVMQAHHPGKRSLGKKVDSLRVAASAAASLRVHQPTAVRPSGNPVSSLEEPPRAPTPIPQTANQLRRPRVPAYKSSLSVESYPTEGFGYKSPSLAPQDAPSFATSAGTSPETDHVLNTDDSAEEPGSSPPMIPDTITCQSSPALPPLRPNNDLNMLGTHLDDLSADEDGGDRPVNAEDIEIAKQYNARPGLIPPSDGVAPKPVQQPRSTSSSKKPRPTKDPQAISRENARRAASFRRSQTWSGETLNSDPMPSINATKEAGSSAGSPEEGPKPKGRQTKYDKERRKAAVQSKLGKAVASGEMPPYCEVCGAIETPTWRKAFSKIFSGSDAGVKISKGDGAIVCCQVLETNEDGSTKLFKVFKKSLLDTDEGFSEFLLCNPCGLWLANRNKLRPENLWNNDKRKEEKERPPRPTRSKKLRANSELPSDIFGSQFDAPSDTLTPAAQDETAQSPAEQENAAGSEKVGEPELPPMSSIRGGHDASKVPQSETGHENLLDPSAYAALERAIRSSPNRFLGSKNSPMNLDQATSDPARRTLFSSPQTSGPLGIDANGRASAKPNSENLSPTKQKTQAAVTEVIHSVVSDEAGKQMLPGRSVTPDPFEDLTKALAPVTPSKTNTNTLPKTPSDLFKTPSNKSSQSQKRISTNDFFSSAAKAFLHQGDRTPSRTPSKNNRQHLEPMTPFTRNLKELLSEPMGQESSPSRFMGVFGDVRGLPPLPPLGNGNDVPIDFDFSDFNTTSELGLTSSPPRWFGLSEDATEGGLWEDVGFGSSPAKASEKENESPKEVTEDPVAA